MGVISKILVHLDKQIALLQRVHGFYADSESEIAAAVGRLPR